jgi:toxin ParE1/3/4
MEAAVQQALYIAETSPVQALRFLDAVESTLGEVEAMPGMGHRYESTNPKLSEVNSVHVSGFRNPLIFYQVTADSIVFLHLLHGARDIASVLDEEL